MEKKDDFFEDVAIVIITPEGSVLNLERVEGEHGHNQAFLRAQDDIPDILEGYPYDLKISGGYELSAFTGASGNVVIWPTNICQSNPIVITVPEVLSDEQGKALEMYLPKLREKEVHATKAHFKGRTPKVVSLDTKGKWDIANEKIRKHIMDSKLKNSLENGNQNNTCK